MLKGPFSSLVPTFSPEPYKPALNRETLDSLRRSVSALGASQEIQSFRVAAPTLKTQH